jgi:hypothetical protein
MRSLLVVLTLIAAMAAAANIPAPILNADRREKVSFAALDARKIQQAIAEEYGRLAAPTFTRQAAPPAIIPDPTLTPGAVRTTDVGEVCSTSTRDLRHWSRERDDHIMREYGLPSGAHPQYEVDHLIPLCLGGADSDANLWPEPRRSIEPVWSAERKDELETRICALACSGQLDVREAQHFIAEDWTEAFRHYIGEPR